MLGTSPSRQNAHHFLNEDSLSKDLPRVPKLDLGKLANKTNKINEKYY